MNNLCKLKENINIRGHIFQDELLSNHTSFKIGGCADLFIEPINEEEIISLVNTLNTLKIPLFVLGGGSNILVSDKGIKDVVISTASLNSIRVIEEKNNEILLKVDAGCTIERLTTWCLDNLFTGLETFAGLPGTIGGAVYMNARCYGVSINDIITSVNFFDIDAQEKKLYTYISDDWDYKKSPFQNKNTIILSIIISVKYGDKNIIAQEMEKYISDRNEKGHFRFPSAGSIFKNNRDFGKPTGCIIDEAGLRGYSIGGAQIAPWHGNIIINRDKASASDVMHLIEYIIEYIKEKNDFILEPEIIFIGE